jgi:lipopolysaccharide biosynthesis protein
VTPVVNSGRDVVPFLGLLHDPWLLEADLVLKIHTKRSPHLPIGKGEYWRTSLLQGLAPLDARRKLGLQRVLCQAATSRRAQVVWPIRWAYSIESWGANRKNTLQIESHHSPTVTLPLLFPAGTMFWCNQPFLGELRTSLASAMQSWSLGDDTTLDGGMVHAVERFIGVLAGRTRAITVTW